MRSATRSGGRTHSLGVITIALLLGGCRAKTPAESATKVVVEAAKREAKAKRDTFSGLKSATLSGGELSGGDAQGRPLWKLSAKTIRASGGVLGAPESDKNAADDGPKTATLTEARATLFREGKAESTLQAPQIVLFYLKDGVRLQLSKGVKGTTQGAWTGARGPVQIAAPRADVDVQKRVINASGGVQMTQGQTRVSAQTLRAQTSLQNVEVKGNVRASSTANGAVSGKIEAKSAVYDWKTNRLRAQTVTALREATRLTGDVLDADTGAQSGVLTGHVHAQNAAQSADAPRLDFGWQRDQIRAPDAIFHSPQGDLRAKNIVTDSKLRLSSATDLLAQSDGATLRAASAAGFSGLTSLTAMALDYRRADMHFTAPRGVARKVGAKWVLDAQGGARGENSEGKVSAPRVTWDENRGRVEASGGVKLEKAGAVLTGETLSSDTKFQSAILSGKVRGVMADGSVLTAPKVEKRGAKFVASQGATAILKSRGDFGALTLRGAQIEAAADASSALATGGVTLRAATGATAKAPRATYNRAAQTVTATGGVEFFDPARGLSTRGDSLVYNLKTGTATLSGARGQGDLNLFEGKKLF